ncbi:MULTISPECIES: SDR family NAD(P)-dependent oxidoreductase [Tepidanaerobacter]|uniref:SDR family NAD(P)-dependent oxidoreductase n=1 Tax=Tepidanaerobacter TaxID=499228 RepID=UPI000AB2ECB7|nr:MULTISPECIES: SDR family NAD(P)-dependent oxidoreductase [Tepidanaerobacter]
MNERTTKAQFDYFGIEGKTAIVTGSGNGIGRATAIMLAKLGSNVTVCDIENESANNVTKEIINNGGRAIGIRCDVCQLEDIRNTIDKTIEEFGNVDILINNAAGFGGGKTIDDMTYEEWNRLIQLNLTSAYMFTMEVLPYMKAKMHGKIVMVSSGAGIVGDFSDPHYAASKAGMIGLGKELAHELAAYRINVNILGTGLTDTRMSRSNLWNKKTQQVPWYRIGLPEDQAAAIAYMVSESADYLTGQVICPNGGAWM